MPREVYYEKWSGLRIADNKNMSSLSSKHYSFVKLGISLFFFILFYILAFSEVVFAGDAIPPWMVKVESTYKCDQSIVATPCKASIHGVGFLIYIPAKEELGNIAHYLVMTDAHLSNGNYDSDSLKISSRYKNSWHKLNLVKKRNQLVRLSDNSNDIDLIEVEKPPGIADTSMFQYYYNVEKPRNSYFWTQDDTAGKGYNEVTVAQDVFVIAPPDLSKKPDRFNQENYDVNLSRGAVTSELLRKDDEFIKGINLASYGKEFLTQSHIVGGMSGSPMLKRVPPGELIVLGLSKRYHRYFNRSYFSKSSQLSELLLDFGQRHYFSSSDLKAPDSNVYSWSFIPYIGTFLKDTKRGVSEFPHGSLNSGNFDLINSGDHETADGGDHETADGGDHETADGGDHETADGGDLTANVKSQLRKKWGMLFENKQILGFSMTIPPVSDGKRTAPETTFNIYGNLDGVGFIRDMQLAIKQKYNREFQVKFISNTTNLKDLLKTKLLNSPEFSDPLSIGDKLKDTIYASSADRQKAVVEQYTTRKHDLGVAPVCLLNKASIDRLISQKSNQRLEIALLRRSEVNYANDGARTQMQKAYFLVDVPLDLSWQKGTIPNKTGPDLIYDAKGLFFLNVSDPICPSLNCPMVGQLNKTPYISFKWKEESESTIANCFVLKNEAFFESLKAKKLISGAL